MDVSYKKRFAYISEKLFSFRHPNLINFQPSFYGIFVKGILQKDFICYI